MIGENNAHISSVQGANNGEGSLGVGVGVGGVSSVALLVPPSPVWAIVLKIDAIHVHLQHLVGKSLAHLSIPARPVVCTDQTN